MRQGRAIRQANRSIRLTHQPNGRRRPKALAAAFLAASMLSPAPSAAATAAALPASSAAASPEPIARLDASRLADRTIPGALALQPIVLAQREGFSVRDVTGPPDQPLPLEISLPPEAGDLFRVVMIRGLPDDFKLTSGVSLEDAWALSPGETERAALVAPPGYSGEFSFEVLFIHGNGEEREQKIVNVRIGPEPAQGPNATAANQTQEPEGARQTLSPEIQASMFDRAERMMADGDIAGARLMLRYLAENGVAGAAFAMGQTYDPGFLEDIYVRGEDPADLAKAREWYQRAAQMGNADARSRLTALE